MNFMRITAAELSALLNMFKSSGFKKNVSVVSLFLQNRLKDSEQLNVEK